MKGVVMLVLSRKIGERVCIGSSVMVTVASVKNGRVRLAFDAPDHLAIDREEVRGRVHESEVESVANEP
jgi:carbon storage regulator